jgi:hypothetical protein
VVAGGALAARLRQQAPSILAHLRSRGWALQGLRFKARPQREAAETSVPIHPRTPSAAIPEEASVCLRRLLTEVHDPGLKASLRSLLRRTSKTQDRSPRGSGLLQRTQGTPERSLSPGQA